MLSAVCFCLGCCGIEEISRSQQPSHAWPPPLNDVTVTVRGSSGLGPHGQAAGNVLIFFNLRKPSAGRVAKQSKLNFVQHQLL